PGPCLEVPRVPGAGAPGRRPAPPADARGPDRAEAPARGERLPVLLDELAGRGRGPLYRTGPPGGAARARARVIGRGSRSVRARGKPAGVVLAVAFVLGPAAAATAQLPPPEPPVDQSELVNTLLSGLLGFGDMTGPELQKEVGKVGGIAFREDVPL